MAYIIDPLTRRIILSMGTTSFQVQDMYSRWKDWVLAEEQHARFPPAFRPVGGEPLAGGLFVAQYFFLINGWKIRPYEGQHTLTITGNLFTDDGSDPIIPTVGSYNVLVNRVVPVQAQGIAVSGSVLTLSEIEQSDVLAKERTSQAILNATYAQL